MSMAEISMLQPDNDANELSYSDDTLGGRIAHAREAMGLSAAQLARRLGIKTPTLAMWESDRAEPRANRLIMLAGLLGVSPGWLLTGEGDAPAFDPKDRDLRQVRLELLRFRDEAAAMTRRIDEVVKSIELRMDAAE